MTPSLGRRRFLAAAIAASASGLSGCSQIADAPSDQVTTDPSTTTDSPGTTADPEATTDEPTTESLPGSVGLETLVDGLEAPLDVTFVPDADVRYVVEQQGIVHVHDADGLADDPLLDLRESVVAGGEQGLLGIELHPEFAENRRLFVRYSAPNRPGTPDDYSHTFALAEFSVSEDGRRADPDSERTILEIPQPQRNHNAGDLAFGPDGFLYVAVGDGGGAGDSGAGHAEDWYDGNEGGNGQDVTENLLGSILRIDVDSEASETPRNGDGETVDEEGEDGRAYAIPEDNPFVGREGLDEHYAWGLRNPWRMSFDGEDLFVADVGQNRYEEVNLVEAGGNYGWNVREGRACYGADDCPDETPGDVRDGEPLLDPIVEYPHSGEPVSGVSIIGGYVYRGSALPGLVGAYVFGDLQADGRLFVATRPEGGGEDGDDEGGQWPTRVVEMAGEDGDKIGRILSFGRDQDGEVYVLGTGSGGGGVHRIVPVES